MGSFWKSISVRDCQTYLAFLSQIFVFLESGSLLLHKCVKEPHFGKTCICREIKSIIMVKVFSVSCISFKEMLSVRYRKCILPTYPESNIRQAWKFNILWAWSRMLESLASSRTKFSVLLNARHREICLRHLVRSFPSVSLQKHYFMFLINLNGQKHATQPLYLK